MASNFLDILSQLYDHHVDFVIVGSPMRKGGVEFLLLRSVWLQEGLCFTYIEIPLAFS